VVAIQLLRFRSDDGLSSHRRLGRRGPAPSWIAGGHVPEVNPPYSTRPGNCAGPSVAVPEHRAWPVARCRPGLFD
jgi:hypothetical protein